MVIRLFRKGIGSGFSLRQLVGDLNQVSRAELILLAELQDCVDSGLAHPFVYCQWRGDKRYIHPIYIPAAISAAPTTGNNQLRRRGWKSAPVSR
ncbi:hypothetical protein [Pantoea coffeiphila]|uniref:hypothetical protein n=1 Tax=Pantoea coffeiphila TaxID=1465635 RepID=UPI0019601F01|nr:hypothetical protein [Pantoea coffeiphila]MBM7346221.1 hypothetical protein [Pantoea coffeiphila]